MHKSLIALALGAALAACNAPQQDIPDAPTLYVSMTEEIDPASEEIQGAAFDIYNDDGELDASLLDIDRWANLSETAGELERLGIAFSETATFTVAGDDIMLLNEGEDGVATKADVRGYIEAREAAFREEWTQFAAAAQAVSVAADAQNAADFEEAALGLQDTCTSCHNKFWYKQDETSGSDAG